MGKKKSYVGINIQFPISQLIVSGKKTIETRTYPIPDDYVGKEMALVETPGREGKFKSRIIAIVQFGPSFKYESKSTFYADVDKHCVTKDSPWAWQQERGKWGWPIISVRRLAKPGSIVKRLGIKFTKDLDLQT
jgi:hypothetical protein